MSEWLVEAPIGSFLGGTPQPKDAPLFEERPLCFGIGLLKWKYEYRSSHRPIRRYRRYHRPIVSPSRSRPNRNCVSNPKSSGMHIAQSCLRRTRHDPRESVVPHQNPRHGWLEERLDDASSIAHRLHLFAGRAGNSEYSLGTDESRPSAFRCNWKSPVIYRRLTRRSDTF